MYTIWVLAVAIAAVSADVSLGYHYKVPQTSYGVPSYQFGESSSHSSGLTSNSGSSSGFNYKGHTSQGGYQGSSLSSSGFHSKPSHGSSGFHIGESYQYGSGSSGQYYPSIGSSSQSTGHYYPSTVVSSGSSGLYYPSTVSSSSSDSANIVRPIYSHGGGSSYNLLPGYNHFQNHYQTLAANKYQQYYVQQQPAQVYKHFYVHSAPEEPELPKPRQPIVLPPPQKHYKIIFVKTPTQTRTPQVIPVPQQHEEKTIVYVLSKKPEEQQDILVPKIEQKPPTKPEVFFVKYNNKEDSQAVINNIVKDYNQGQSVTFSGIGDDSQGTVGSGSQGFGTVSQGFGSDSQGFGSDSLGFGSGSQGAVGFGSHGTIGSSLSSSFGSGSQGVFSSGSHSEHGSGFHSSPTTITQGNYAGFLSDAPVEVPTPVSGFGTQTFGISDSSVPHTFSVGTADTSSLISVPAISAESSTAASDIGIISTTPSSISYDDATPISTSQGVPHETYGPPKFRVN